jgi:hypothetical protein
MLEIDVRHLAYQLADTSHRLDVRWKVPYYCRQLKLRFFASGPCFPSIAVAETVV